MQDKRDLRDGKSIIIPISTKNNLRQREPEMRFRRMGNQHYHGIKIHIGQRNQDHSFGVYDGSLHS